MHCRTGPVRRHVSEFLNAASSRSLRAASSVASSRLAANRPISLPRAASSAPASTINVRAIGKSGKPASLDASAMRMSGNVPSPL